MRCAGDAMTLLIFMLLILAVASDSRRQNMLDINAMIPASVSKMIHSIASAFKITPKPLIIFLSMRL